jgi:hypothetical protein
MSQFREWVEERTREDGGRTQIIAGIALGLISGALYLTLSRFPDMEAWALIGAACVCAGPMNYLEKTAGRPLRKLNLSAVATLAVMAAVTLLIRFL